MEEMLTVSVHAGSKPMPPLASGPEIVATWR